ncbi:FAD-binding oxidoreductase [Notoacmeibacter sp. MSK16QG-6]|uniref:FAD-binding oxidoreductase n=1 Tax=Notoacmeibacter sp. MSK16QG-6 TaxID=2957982 RepID=UPI00209F50E3|nr:FAD-binding oxidoreductase [Notoacmeibacter sp. MSK16QG-6]MCP1198248.1 FAD-binding oxidoreductase [Notoacmeibacter sp. MSK16QG-6]
MTMAPDLIDRFTAIVGDKYALRDDADTAPYRHELRKLFHGETPLVLRPASTDEVAAILRLASETGTAIVPQGGNTGLVGGQTPDDTGSQIILSLSRLCAIREIDTDAGTMTVEAGVPLQTVRQAAADRDLMFPLSIASQGTAQIGGILATNAGGVNVLANGNARDLCLGLEVVLPSGEVLDDLRKLRKDNSGYDLKNLFVGAEGTLGVITAAVLKLAPQPKGRQIAWATVGKPADALKLFRHAASAAGGALTAFELMADRAVRLAQDHISDVRVPIQDEAAWHVLIEISSGRSEEEARGLAEEILSAALDKGTVIDAVLASSIAQGADFWKVRESIPDAQRVEGASIKHDISVPVSSIPAFIAEAGAAVEKTTPEGRLVCFGHMGDGNLHFNVQGPSGAGDEFLSKWKPLNAAVHEVVRRFGGSFAAEHGVGALKRDELIATKSAVALDLMRRIKQTLDPACIMNPGKVI